MKTANNLALAICVSLTVAPSICQASMMSDTNPADRMFIHQAAIGGDDEIALSRIAVERSDNPNIRRFARKMIMQHSQANAQLRQIADSLGVSTPMGADAKHRHIEARLERLSGSAFNDAFINVMVKDHTVADQIFKMGATVDNEQLRNFAVETLPVVENHLQMATDMQAGMDTSKMASM